MSEQTSKGRPTKFRPEYIDLVDEYFNRPCYKVDSNGDPLRDPNERLILNDYPTLPGFALLCGVCRDTIYAWTKTPGLEDFSYAIKRAKDYQTKFIQEAGMLGLVNPTYAIYMERNLGIKINIDDCKTASEKNNRVIEYATKGYVNPDEALKVSNMIKNSVAIDESTQLKEDIEALKKQAGLE
ncbi:hypothetical protein [uncultured Mediterranean phage uvMED]|nr:hypothetical protein [uncultured Mediterranean phage uvMED]